MNKLSNPEEIAAFLKEHGPQHPAVLAGSGFCAASDAEKLLSDDVNVMRRNRDNAAFTKNLVDGYKRDWGGYMLDGPGLDDRIEEILGRPLAPG